VTAAAEVRPVLQPMLELYLDLHPELSGHEERTAVRVGAALGKAMDSSRARFEQTIRAVLRLWTEPKVSEDGEFLSYTEATSRPAVVQQPPRPDWRAACTSSSMRSCPRHRPVQ
jgi:alkanesulfonate monooxygenase SsuD/methylene tetrahydromethanopterin reductase-like flavin-dependent oxidoreductase (luciferase family)